MGIGPLEVDSHNRLSRLDLQYVLRTVRSTVPPQPVNIHHTSQKLNFPAESFLSERVPRATPC